MPLYIPIIVLYLWHSWWHRQLWTIVHWIRKVLLQSCQQHAQWFRSFVCFTCFQKLTASLICHSKPEIKIEKMVGDAVWWREAWQWTFCHLFFVGSWWWAFVRSKRAFVVCARSYAKTSADYDKKSTTVPAHNPLQVSYDARLCHDRPSHWVRTRPQCR